MSSTNRSSVPSRCNPGFCEDPLWVNPLSPTSSLLVSGAELTLVGDTEWKMQVKPSGQSLGKSLCSPPGSPTAMHLRVQLGETGNMGRPQEKARGTRGTSVGETPTISVSS